MARQVLPIVGAFVGAYFGNPQLGYAIGSIIGNAVDPLRVKGPTLKEIPSQTAGEGSFRQVVYGTSIIRDTNIIDFGDVERVKTETQQGKGGGPIVEGERLLRTYAIGLGEPFAAVRWIRRNGVVVYDIRPGSTILAESAAFAQRFRFYNGSETQLPDPDLEALPHNGVGNTPAYRGSAYMVFPRDDLTDLQGQIPTYEVEAVAEGEVSVGANWFAGPVVVASSNAYYVRAATAPGLLTADPVPLPAEGSGTLTRISVANGQLFFHRDVAACVSGDNGATWDACDNSLWGGSWARDVFWNGTRYYYGGVSSADRVTWTAIPNLPATALVQSARASDGMVVVQSTDGVFHTSLDNGASWTAATDAGSGRTDTIATDGEDYVFNSSSNFHYYSDDDLATPSNPVVQNDNVLGSFYANGAWFTFKFLSGDGIAAAIGILRATDLATWPNGSLAGSFAFIEDGVDLDANLMVFDGQGTCVARYQNGTDCDLYLSTDNGMSWTLAGTLAEPIASIAYVPGAGISPVDAVSTTLQAVVEDVCDRCGLPAGKLDMAALTDEIAGITLGGQYGGAGAITTLMPAYFFDIFEADKQLIAVKRGAAVKATITVDALVEEPDENSLRGQDTEYPRQLMVKYLNPGQNYAAPAAVVSRKTPDIRVRGEVTLDLPISLTETPALQIADKILKVMWEDLNGEATFTLPLGPFAWLTPSDCLGYVARSGAVYRLRVEKVNDAAREITITARRDRQSAYTSALTAIPLPAPPPPPPSLPGVTQVALLNIPGIIDSDDQLGFRIGVCGQEGSAWYGAQVAYSTDGGLTYTSLGNITTRAVMGMLTAPLAAASEFYPDRTNSIEVELVDTDELESLTEAQWLSEGNGAAIVRGDYTAEVVQFQTATDLTNREWSLSTLQRGRLATSAAAHLTGERFVMLEGTVFLPLPSSVIGQTIKIRVTSLGTSPEVAPVFDFAFSPAYSQREFAPADLSLTSDGTDITASWSPRHRFGTEDNPIASANLLGYRVEATDGVTTKVTELVTSTTHLIPEAPFTGSVTVTVYPINRFTGLGPSIAGTIDL